jgi:hypothetical protein
MIDSSESIAHKAAAFNAVVDVLVAQRLAFCPPHGDRNRPS